MKLANTFVSPMPWQWYRDFFSLSYIRYMATWFAIVPVAAYALSRAPAEVTLQFVTPPMTIQLGLPFSWQVLWIASLVFVAAFTIYLSRAPTFVRRYHSLDDYLAKGHSPRWLCSEAQILFNWGADRQKLVKRLLDKGYAVPDHGPAPPEAGEVIVASDTTNFRFTHGGKNYLMAMPIVDDTGAEDVERTSTAVREVFWEIFARYAESRIVARRVMVSCLFAALLCVLFVVLQHVLSALPYFLPRL